MADREDSTVERRFVPKLHASWIPMTLTFLMVAAIAALAAFGLRYVRDSTFQEGRSFRVLGEVAQQLDNMQGSLSNLLRLIPESVAPTDVGRKTCTLDEENVRRYLRKLDLQGLDLKPIFKDSGTPLRTTASLDYELTLSLNDPRRSFSIRHSASSDNQPQSDDCALQIRGNLRQHLPAFVSQGYFDAVLLTLEDGEILARIPRTPSQSSDLLKVELQKDTSDTALVNDARGLLALAATQGEHASLLLVKDMAGDGAAGKEGEHAEGKVPQHAVGFSHAIGERTYDISVLPIRSDSIVRVQGAKAISADAPVSTFYLIGLKRQDLSRQVSDTLGAGGAFAATIAVLLGVLLWPFLSLRLSPPDSAFAGFQVFAIVVSLTLLSVVLTSTAVWMWSDIRLRAWADRGAEGYAKQLEQSVQGELDESAWLLRQYSGLSPPYPASLPVRRNAGMARATSRECENGSLACKLFLHEGLEADTLRHWSPLRTALRLTNDGRNCPPRISAFGDLPTRTDVDVHDREYFVALQEHQAWTPRWSSTRFVAQRLFNRSDAARVLQLIVPGGGEDSRQHITTGDTRAYAVSASVRPPLLRFAVVDRSNGEVLFHSNDERSLAENLLMETGNNVQLHQALLTRLNNAAPIALTDHFDGTYLGESQRFHYRPVEGIPWGIVVFYSTETLREISFDAAIATMTHCVSIVTLLVLTIVVITFLWNKRVDRYLLAAVWPQWEWRSRYPRIALTLTGFWIVALIALLYELRFGSLWVSLGVLVAAAAAGGWFVVRSRWSIVKNPGLGCYRLFYVWSAVAALGVTVTLPTLLLAISYQDLSVGEYLRSELFHASQDVEHRELLMKRDLRRWVAIESDRKTLYPDGASLAVQLPVPGYTAHPGNDDTPARWRLTAFNELPWIAHAGPSQPGRVRRMIWRRITLAHPEYTSQSAGTSRTDHDADVAANAVRLTRETFSIEAPARLAENASIVRRRACTDESESCLAISPDVEHHDLWASINAALLLGLCVILVLSFLISLTARRLCGIRIPFAARYADLHGQHLPFGPLLATEQRIDQARAEFSPDFTSKDATDIRRIDSGPHYREVWRALSPDERHLLHQLALGQFANPENAVIIERLLHRGLIRLRPWPVITDPGLADFARTAPHHEEFRGDRLQWASTAAASTWHRIRVPLLTGGILTAVGLMAFAGGSMQILLTSLAGVTALLGHVTNVTNFVRKDGGK